MESLILQDQTRKMARNSRTGVSVLENNMIQTTSYTVYHIERVGLIQKVIKRLFHKVSDTYLLEQPLLFLF
ncbi:hypothetical protein [Alkalihalobacillus sp. TS-13]|uniref:hypothetical protein n=1 Tax=Alkalihalobacillus sp. TS-13 TaxID=2842455 RepID=UPI0021AA6498|nr:hypothetical protein [Alkalihalobacillus sp. TS-13]